jgi:uncharacterized membrane protein
MLNSLKGHLGCGNGSILMQIAMMIITIIIIVMMIVQIHGGARDARAQGRTRLT